MLLFLSIPDHHPLPLLDSRQHASSWLEPQLSEQVTRGSGSLKASHGLVLGPAPQDTAVPFYLYKHGGFAAACSNLSKGWTDFHRLGRLTFEISAYNVLFEADMNISLKDPMKHLKGR